MNASADMSRVRRNALLATIMLGTLLGPLDSAVNIAFPDITRSFRIELAAIRWVIITYVATYASLMLVFGRLGDLFGHHLVFGAGLLVCAAAFALCSLAQGYEQLLVARLVQGIGTAMVLSCGTALATSLFHERHRPRILGLYAMMFGLGGAVGPSLGGMLVDNWGWSAVFWFRLPLAAVALVLVIFLRLPPASRDDGRFDWAGAILLTLATGLLLFTISQAQWVGSRPLSAIALLIATLLAITACVATSYRTATPVLDMRAFRNLRFSWINLTNIVINLTGFATMLFVPYFVVRISTLPLSAGGLVMALGPLAMMVASHLAGQVIERVGAARLALAASCLVAGGLAWISIWDHTTAWPTMAAALVLHGAGLGLFQVAGLEVVAQTLPIANRGVAGSLALVMRTVGVVVAASTLTLAFAGFEAQAIATAKPDAFIWAFRQVFRWVASALAIYGLASVIWISLWQTRRP